MCNNEKNFYKEFVKLCNSVGKTPCRVVLECGLSKPCVTRWKNGSYPTDATAMKIADYFASFECDREERPSLVPVRKIRILRKDVVHDC